MHVEPFRQGGLKRMTLALIAGCSGALAAHACSSSESARDTATTNPAYAWHDSVMAELGGEQGWARARYIKFRWNVFRGEELVSNRLHHWDRYDGRYRLETTLPEGSSLLALFNVNSREGTAWLDGTPVSGAAGDSLVERAHAMFINDSYWLLMPYKWRDPGVRLESLGPRSDEDGSWQVFHLSFEDVGLTPGDQYWVYVSADPPHLVRKWQYHLQGREGKGPFIKWKDWQQFGPIKLATERESVNRDFRIEFKDVEVARRVPRRVFAPPTAN